MKLIPSPSKKRREETRSLCTVRDAVVCVLVASDEAKRELVVNPPMRTLPFTSKLKAGVLQLIPIKPLAAFKKN